MRSIVKSSFIWQFAIGFALGAAGVVSLEPIDARHALAGHFAPERLHVR